jgi:hypothetical protein
MRKGCLAFFEGFLLYQSTLLVMIYLDERRINRSSERFWRVRKEILVHVERTLAVGVLWSLVIPAKAAAFGKLNRSMRQSKLTMQKRLLALLELATLAEYDPSVTPVAPVAALLPHPPPFGHVSGREIAASACHGT